MSETFDFVAIGSGGGALCAALVLRAAGTVMAMRMRANMARQTPVT